MSDFQMKSYLAKWQTPKNIKCKSTKDSEPKSVMHHLFYMDIFLQSQSGIFLPKI